MKEHGQAIKIALDKYKMIWYTVYSKRKGEKKMINDMFGLYYVARDAKKFNALMSKYKKIRKEIREISDEVSDEEATLMDELFSELNQVYDALVHSQIKKIRPNEWMKNFLSSFGNEEIKDKKITEKQVNIFLGYSEAICRDRSSITYAFKYAGMVYYICVIHGKYYYLTMKKEVA